MRSAGPCGRRPLAASGVLLALATIAGAVGAHVLHSHWRAERMQVYDTAVRYQFYHSLGLLGIGLLLRTEGPRILRTSAWLVFAGIVLFSGSLYALALGAPHWVGIATPFGGVALISGWLLFACGVWRS